MKQKHAFAKLASSIMNKEASITALVGLARAADLSDDEKKILRDHYNLDDSANLTARNAVRGLSGGILGTAGGSVLGGLLGALIAKNPAYASRFNELVMGGTLLGSGFGAGAGTALMTDKYSHGNAKKIRKEEERKPAKK